ncbi:MAG: DNA recombination protein RmuC [Rhodocyclaceae bacterium]|nr:DNA recombination protein RmuC [Rhodocyclaceae bacterium]MBX3667510.1 DNA recombination protein RmuC [Rhodocyclaceae bacterium]
MDTLYLNVLWLATGLAAGAIAAWLAARTRAELAAARREAESAAQIAALSERAAQLAGLQQQLRAAEARRDDLADDMTDLRTRLAEAGAQLNGERAAREELKLALEAESDRQRGLSAQNAELQARLAEATSLLAAEREQSEQKLALLAEARRELTDQFKALAGDILEDKSRRFTEQNQANLGQLLEPLRQRISEFQARVDAVHARDGKDRSALAEQLRQLMELNQTLAGDAKNLTQALKGSSKTQGTWGELVLERVLEASGLRRGEEYEVQLSHTREDGSRAQPDVVLRLPENRCLIVDAKVSLAAYEDYATAEDDAGREQALRRHLDSVRAHVKGLAERNYQNLYPGTTADFVLMFLPVEPAFMLAVSQDRELFMTAWQRNVLLVSPSTLLFVVRTVAHLWRQEAQNRNAQDIARRGAELYDRLCGFVADMEKLGERLKQAQESFDAARDKLARNKGNVIRQAEMLKELGVKPARTMPGATADLAARDEDGASERRLP